MGAAASQEDIKKLVADLSDDDKKKYAELLNAAEASADVEANKGKIKENKSKLYEIEQKVMENKQNIYGQRAFVEENRQLILKNYAAAFMGNRQMINQNTDDIFKNRYAILKTLKTSSQVEVNFRESKINEAKVDFLDHRSKLNAKVGAVSEKMAAANSMFIEINDSIMENNGEIVAFNQAQIVTNSKLLEAGIMPEKCTPEANAARITSNGDRMAEVLERAKANATKCAEVLEKAKANRSKVLENSEAIYARRAEIEENHKKIAANAATIVTRIMG